MAGALLTLEAVSKSYWRGPHELRVLTVLGVPKGVGAGTLEGQVSKIKVICKDKEATTEGEVTGPKTSIKNVILFKECAVREPAMRASTDLLAEAGGSLSPGCCCRSCGYGAPRTLGAPHNQN